MDVKIPMETFEDLERYLVAEKEFFSEMIDNKIMIINKTPSTLRYFTYGCHSVVCDILELIEQRKNNKA